MDSLTTVITKAQFLDALERNGGGVSAACRQSGANRNQVYQWRKADKEFADAWDEAIAAKDEVLETTAYERAVYGVKKPIHYKGGSLLSTMSPYPDSQETKDPVLREVVGLMNETRTVPLAMPGRRVEGMKLTVDEYDELVRISRTEDLIDGKTFREQVMETMDSEVYALATPDYRVVLLKGVQNAFDTAAKKELETRNTGFADRISDYRLRKRRKLFGDVDGPDGQ